MESPAGTSLQPSLAPCKSNQNTTWLGWDAGVRRGNVWRQRGGISFSGLVPSISVVIAFFNTGQEKLAELKFKAVSSKVWWTAWLTRETDYPLPVALKPLTYDPCSQLMGWTKPWQKLKPQMQDQNAHFYIVAKAAGLWSWPFCRHTFVRWRWHILKFKKRSTSSTEV